jgi:outer membrane protein TolC
MGPAYNSAQNTMQGFAKQKVQHDMVYSPQLVAHAVRVDDRSEQASVLLTDMYGQRTLGDDYEVALVKKWKYGLTTSVGYGWGRTKVDDAAYMYDGFDPYKYYQVHPTAAVTMALWRDFIGNQTSAQVDHTRYLMENAEYGAANQRESVLYRARAAYWSLQLARQEVDIRMDTYQRSVSIVAWSERRVRLNLVDDSEALQAKAGMEVRSIELEHAVENERAARVDFNRFRGVQGNEVPEQLNELGTEITKYAFKWPSRTPRSWELRAAQAKINSDEAAWKDAKGNAKPDLNVFASYTANGVDTTFDPADTESFKDRRPTTKVGASVVIPLDVFTASKAADGYKLTYNASKDAYRDKALETDQAWAQLKDRLDDVNKRLEMATRIEDIQKRKLAKEREQLNVGRSTQFQLQSFETDYQMSRLQRLGVQAEKLFLWAEAEWLLSADRADAENGKSVAKAEVK